MSRFSGEEAFVVKPSALEGVGCFTIVDLPEGTLLELFLVTDYEEEALSNLDGIPEPLRKYCFKEADGKYRRPVSFNCLDIGYYMNHSDTPNVGFSSDFLEWVALRDISAGEELCFDYGKDKGF